MIDLLNYIVLWLIFPLILILNVIENAYLSYNGFRLHRCSHNILGNMGMTLCGRYIEVVLFLASISIIESNSTK